MKADWKSFLADAGAEFDGDTVSHFGNPVREARAAFGGTVFADLGFMGVIAAYGEDAGTFLQSQFSNDVTAIEAGGSQLTAFCTPKGRMLGLMRLFRSGETWYLRLPVDTLEPVLQRLRMYVMRASVTLEDATENFIRMGVAGADAAVQLQAAIGGVPDAIDGMSKQGDTIALRVPGVQPRFEVYVSSLEAARELWDSLNVQAAPVGEPVWGLLEIQAGVPNVFAATTGQFIPQMTNLTTLNGISFTKGCYPGQEIVARTRYLGRLKRRMYLGRIAQDAPVGPGEALYSGADGDQAAGQVVDARPHPDGGQLALAVLQISAADQGDIRLGSPDGAAFALLDLPYPVEESEPGGG